MDETSAPTTAHEQRRATRGANRTLALALSGVAMVFLVAAVAAGLLMLHGPY